LSLFFGLGAGKNTFLLNSCSIIEYLGKPCIGVEGFCFSRRTDRLFRVDRILGIDEVK
jgi:hypothetical protein